MNAVDPATAEAEAFLRADLEYNQTHKIWPSHNRIIERLLTDSEKLRPLYAELARSLRWPDQRREILNALVNTAAVATPDKTAEIRQQKRLAEELNKEIRVLAKQLRPLVDLLRERRERCPDIEPLRLPSFVELMGDAVYYNEDPFKAYQFEKHLSREFAGYGDEYWPSVEEFITALADILLIRTDHEKPLLAPLIPSNAANSPEPACPLMAEAIRPRSHSWADFVRAIDLSIDDLRLSSDVRPHIPADFKLTDQAVECFYAVVTGHKWAEGTLKKRRQRKAQKSRDSSR